MYRLKRNIRQEEVTEKQMKTEKENKTRKKFKIRRISIGRTAKL